MKVNIEVYSNGKMLTGSEYTFVVLILDYTHCLRIPPRLFGQDEVRRAKNMDIREDTRVQKERTAWSWNDTPLEGNCPK